MAKCLVKLLSNDDEPRDTTAKAGVKTVFGSLGRNDDVKCFCCDGGFRGWEFGDDSWEEHAKWFPRCEFLIHMNGQGLVDEIEGQYPHLLEELLSISETPGGENADPPIVHFGSGESTLEDAVMMNTPVVKSVLEMGFSRSLVRQTVQSKILTTGENYKTVNDVVSALLNAEDEKREEEKGRQAEEMASVKEHAAANIFKKCLKEINSTLYKDLFVDKNMKYIPTEDVSGLSLEEQLRRLQEERTCKVCMDKEVSIVFIPCGHLAVCQECAPSLRKCPIGRGIIKGTVRTFL
ncbi:baculoviral IAP repeat-containing protein 2-like [Otolemur garnettii]|uniref:baculoviral IAP repeat-containing protein 2-like n=1 Tax=Otolemur garnettii TaxID=30611 RepID=UPI0006446723|nr:baculoviral IAP repeat-containing protein 2-like [Otolemur garnettii]